MSNEKSKPADDYSERDENLNGLGINSFPPPVTASPNRKRQETNNIASDQESPPKRLFSRAFDERTTGFEDEASIDNESFTLPWGSPISERPMLPVAPSTEPLTSPVNFEVGTTSENGYVHVGGASASPTLFSSTPPVMDPIPTSGFRTTNHHCDTANQFHPPASPSGIPAATAGMSVLTGATAHFSASMLSRSHSFVEEMATELIPPLGPPKLLTSPRLALPTGVHSAVVNGMGVRIGAGASAAAGAAAGCVLLSPSKRRPHDDEVAAAAPERSRFGEDFTTISVIGQGQFGRVLRCVSKLDGCEYAVKSSKAQFKGNSEKKRWLKEVQSLALLSNSSMGSIYNSGGGDSRLERGRGSPHHAPCEHIVRYHNAWIEDGRLFIQMELCERSLEDALTERHGGALRIRPQRSLADTGAAAGGLPPPFSSPISPPSRSPPSRSPPSLSPPLLASPLSSSSSSSSSSSFAGSGSHGSGSGGRRCSIGGCRVGGGGASSGNDAAAGASGDASEIFSLARQMLLALRALHAANLVHLDVKPGNIFVKQEGLYKLGDFGLSRDRGCSDQNGGGGSGSSSDSKDSGGGGGGVDGDDIEEGDARYLPLELLNLPPPGTTRDLTKCDLFSLGCTLYEVCLRAGGGKGVSSAGSAGGEGERAGLAGTASPLRQDSNGAGGGGGSRSSNGSSSGGSSRGDSSSSGGGGGAGGGSCGVGGSDGCGGVGESGADGGRENLMSPPPEDIIASAADRQAVSCQQSRSVRRKSRDSQISSSSPAAFGGLNGGGGGGVGRAAGEDDFEDDFEDAFALNGVGLGFGLEGGLPMNGDEWTAMREGVLRPLPGCPAELVRVLKLLLSPNPADRPSAAQLLASEPLLQSSLERSLGEERLCNQRLREALAEHDEQLHQLQQQHQLHQERRTPISSPATAPAASSSSSYFSFVQSPPRTYPATAPAAASSSSSLSLGKSPSLRSAHSSWMSLGETGKSVAGAMEWDGDDGEEEDGAAAAAAETGVVVGKSNSAKQQQQQQLERHNHRLPPQGQSPKTKQRTASRCLKVVSLSGGVPTTTSTSPQPKVVRLVRSNTWSGV